VKRYLLQFYLKPHGSIRASSIDFDINGWDSTTVSFSKKYFQDYGVQADVFSANTYDCFKIIELAIRNRAKNSKVLQQQLLKINEFHGAGGKFSFDKMGNVVKEFSIYIIEDRNIRKIQ